MNKKHVCVFYSRYLSVYVCKIKERGYDESCMIEDLDVLQKARKIHFIGIGGIGISAIARLMLKWGKHITGSDQSQSIVTDELAKLGARIYKGHRASRVIRNVDVVIYSPAIPKNNVEFLRARRLGIPAYSYPEALGMISRGKYTIAVSGTHGKTTTTAMIGKMLEGAGLKPTMIVGSLLMETRSNLVVGDGDYLVVEADEYKKSFLNLDPKILVITNIEADHLDFYKNLEDIQRAFGELVIKMGSRGALVCDTGLKNLKPILKKAKCLVINYGNISTIPKLKVPGNHNVENARATYAVGRLLKITHADIIKSLQNFEGTWRRFECKGKMKSGALVYDDYAHHPTEIKATLRAAREKFGKQKIIAVFMPHLFSRTKDFLKEFGKSFGDADEVIIADIFPAREKDDGTVHSRGLVAEIKKHGKNARHIGEMDEIEKFLRKYATKGDVIMTIGAGDIYRVAGALIKE